MGSIFSSKTPKPVVDKRAEALQAEQQQKEKARLAEEESELERRKAVASSRVGGRGSLIKTSPSGVTAASKKLGG